jgi:hypothetical protein
MTVFSISFEEHAPQATPQEQPTRQAGDSRSITSALLESINLINLFSSRHNDGWGLVRLTSLTSAPHDADEGLNGVTAGFTELWRRGLNGPAADAASRIEGQAEQQSAW